MKLLFIFLLNGAFVFFSNSFLLNSPKLNLPSVADTNCQVLLAESIPWNLTYSPGSPVFPSTYAIWNHLLREALKEIHLSAFYWTLLGSDVGTNHPSSLHGELIFSKIEELSSKLNVHIAQSGKARPTNNTEIDKLSKAGAKVSYVDIERLMGTGILHTKLWSVDSLHGYVGSANMDFRSLTQVKELGLGFFSCPSIVQDINKIFGAYYLASGTESKLPLNFPSHLTTNYNHTNPLIMNINGHPTGVYLTMSPPDLRPPGWSDDLVSLLKVIHDAKKFIYISVMDYSPEVVYYGSRESTFWPIIDDALRQAAVDRRIDVRLLISKWRYTPSQIQNYLASLHAINGIRKSSLRVRRFIVPAYDDFQRNLDHSRVNHAKYMVTDNTAFIGTSNWSGDYFLYTGGVSFVAQDLSNRTDRYYLNDLYDSIDNLTLRAQVESIFLRDWNSEFAHEL